MYILYCIATLFCFIGGTFPIVIWVWALLFADDIRRFYAFIGMCWLPRTLGIAAVGWLVVTVIWMACMLWG